MVNESNSQINERPCVPLAPQIWLGRFGGGVKAGFKAVAPFIAVKTVTDPKIKAVGENRGGFSWHD